MTGSVPPGANRTSLGNRGSAGELLPPRELQDWVGLGGPAVFKATGDEFLGYLVDLCGLQAGDAVLDVGCGSGRMARPLTGYLNREGRYAGFDVAPEAIAWCTENISGSHPNFDFQVADVQSKRYNPTGKYKPSDFRFPYPDGSFDVVLLASVFTHMLPADVKHYMDEIVRVLKPGGRSLITFFLLNEESSALSEEGMGQITFEHEMHGARTANVDNPEAAIAYPEAFVRDLYGECGLELREPLRYGTWCGRTDGMSGQDVVIAVKAASRNRLAQEVPMIDIQRPTGSTNHPLIALSDENIAFAEAMGVSPAIHENDFIFHFVDRRMAAEGGRERAVNDYFTLGRYTADLTKTMITDVQNFYRAIKWDWAPRRVLDFASGYGCTARHLPHVFPDSICATCDIHIDAVNFNKDVLGVESYVSSPVPEQLKLPPQDIIFAHSFFSHMPETTWARWLKALSNALAPGGVLLFTTHGLVLEKRGYSGVTVKGNGFGFLPLSEQDDLDTAEYGATISHSRWVLSILASMPELRLSKFHEGLWWREQDTYVCVKEPDRLPGCPPSAPNHPTTPESGTSQRMSRMSPAAAEEYIASLYATFLKRDPGPDELAHWVTEAANMPPEQVYFAFVNYSKEYKLQQEKSVPTMFWPGHYDSPIADPSQIFETNPDLTRFGRSISFGENGHSKEVIGPDWPERDARGAQLPPLQEDAYRWMTGRFSVLTLPMPTENNAADSILMLLVTPYTVNGQIDCQRCTVVCGAETVAEVELRASSWIGFRISAEAVVSEKLAILFVHPDAGSPQKFGMSPDSRELAIAVHKAVLLPVTEADELMGWRGRTGQFVSSDWRAQALVPDWKRIALTFQSMGQDCELGLVQRQCEAEPLGLFRFANTWQHTLIQCLLSEFSELTDEQKLNIVPYTTDRSGTTEYFSEYKSLDLAFHTWIRTDQNVDVDALRRKELTRLKMLVRLFREDLEDGEKVFVLLRRHFPLDEFEVLPVISLMRRYNPKAALLWITVAGPDERHLVGQCEMVGNNLLKGYIDRFSGQNDDWSTLSLECWKDIMVSALQALGRPIPTHAQGLPPEQKRLEMS